MKTGRIAFLVLTFSMISFIAFSQAKREVQLIPYGGYTLGGSVKYIEGKMNIQDAATYGLDLNIEIAPTLYGILSWNMTDTKASFDSYYPYNLPSRDFPMSIHYFQVGGLRTLKEGPVEPYGMFTLGMTWANMKDYEIEDDYRFSITLGGGAKFFFSDHLGIRLQARMLMPMYFSGGGMYCGMGSGGSSCGVGVGSTAMLIQGDFTGGLVIKF